MSRRHPHISHSHFFSLSGVFRLVLPYSLIYFFISFGDAIMSYVAPVYLEDHIKNQTLMGMVISSSSVVGIACDLTFSKIFKNRRFTFFLWSALLTAGLFPLTYIVLPPILGIFLLGMAIWGIYYELLLFSDFNFIKNVLPHDSYHAGWGIIGSFKSLAYFLGPLIAGNLIGTSYFPAFWSTILIYMVAGIILAIYWFTLPHRKSYAPNETADISFDWGSELKVWLILIRRIWPVYTFLFLLFLIDASFWTIGTLVSEELRQQSSLGILFLPVFSLPSMFVGFFLGRLFPPYRKKQVAFTAGLFAGIFLALTAFSHSTPVLLIAVFLSSSFMAISFPEISAVFEDYIDRLGKSGSSMIGLQSSASSLSYILGPILAGLLASLVGNRQSFAVLGIILAAYSLISLFITPRKIQLPQAELTVSS